MDPIALAAHMLEFHGYVWEAVRLYDERALGRAHGRDHPWKDPFYSGPNKRHLHTDDGRIIVGTSTSHYEVWKGWQPG